MPSSMKEYGLYWLDFIFILALQRPFLPYGFLVAATISLISEQTFRRLREARSQLELVSTCGVRKREWQLDLDSKRLALSLFHHLKNRDKPTTYCTMRLSSSETLVIGTY